jgi:hypothetical protein
MASYLLSFINRPRKKDMTDLLISLPTAQQQYQAALEEEREARKLQASYEPPRGDIVEVRKDLYANRPDYPENKMTQDLCHLRPLEHDREPTEWRAVMEEATAIPKLCQWAKQTYAVMRGRIELSPPKPKPEWRR